MSWKRTKFSFIQPAIDLKEIGVDYLSAEPDALQRAFAMGREAGLTFAP